MATVKMLRQPRGQYERNPYPEVGTVFEVTDEVAGALVRFKYAERVDAPAEVDVPAATADKREKRG